MAATLELKFYNTFWLKRIKSMQPIHSTTTTGIVADSVASGQDQFLLKLPNKNIQTGTAYGSGPGVGNGDAVIKNGVKIGNINGAVI